MSQKVLKVHPGDNVIVALQDLAKGEKVSYNGVEYTIVDDIPAKHKFFENDMHTGDEVIMYGVLVGKAQTDIPKGGRMTTSNIKHAAEKYDYRGVNYKWEAPDVSKFKERTFNGYHRSDGRVGTANYWLFVPTVFCENRNMDVIREALHNELGYAVSDKYKQFTHNLVESFKK
jgi:altronate hydrolase